MSDDLGIQLVLEFHQMFNCHVGKKPKVPEIGGESRSLLVEYQRAAAELAVHLKSFATERNIAGDEGGALVLIRLQLIREELAELAEAIVDENIVGSLDALGDLSYVVDGTYITLGLHEHKEPGLREIHRSNMSKTDENGKPIISEAGRVMKSDRYSPPDLKKVLSE